MPADVNNCSFVFLLSLQMQQQADRLAKLNAMLRRKHGVCKRQASQLMEDKKELETRLTAKGILIQEMREQVNQNLKTSVSSDQTASLCLSMTSSMMAESCTSPNTSVSDACGVG